MRWSLVPVDYSLMRALCPPDQAALAGGAAQPGGGAGLLSHTELVTLGVGQQRVVHTPGVPHLEATLHLPTI